MIARRYVNITFCILQIVFLALHAFASSEEGKGKSQGISGVEASQRSVSEDTDPHFTGKYCDLCHQKTPQKGGETYLRYNGDFIQMCNCHKYTAGTYIHPVYIVPSEEKKSRIPDEFPLDNDVMTCRTCHDFYKQCQENQELLLLSQISRKHNRLERMFLRGERYRRRTDICFKCHDESKYKMLDPHNQLNAKGEIVIEKCLYCHKNEPDVNTSTFENVELIGDLKVLCQRCHGSLDKHPANVDHFVHPTDKMFTRMKIIEGEFGILLPLDSEGRLTCITCHNPHEKNVIPSEREGSKGAGEKYRHRLPGILCKSCHRM